MVRFVIAAGATAISLVLLLPVFAMSAAIWVFVSCVRAVSRVLERKFVPWSELTTFDAALGWRPRAGIDAHYLAHRDDIFRVVTDSDGWPGRRSLDDSAVIVFGDSFAFGYGVDTGRSFADLNPRPAIKAMGAPGYSMVQSVILMEQLAERLRGKLIVWFVCLENDLEDNLLPAMGGYRAPFVRASGTAGGWEIAAEHVNATPWRSRDSGWKRMFPKLCVPGPIADRVFAVSEYLIGRASAACARAGAHLVVLTIPDPTQLSYAGRGRLATLSGHPALCDVDLPDKRLGEICKRYGVPMVVGKDHLTSRHYKRIEGLHWNREGHRRVADVVARLYDSFKAGQLGMRTSIVPSGRDGLAALHESHAGLR